MPPTYTIKSGDTLSGLAKQNGVSVQAIMAANKGITDPNKISAGSSLVIPKTTIAPVTRQSVQTTTQIRNQDNQNVQKLDGIMQNKLATIGGVPVSTSYSQGPNAATIGGQPVNTTYNPGVQLTPTGQPLSNASEINKGIEADAATGMSEAQLTQKYGADMANTIKNAVTSRTTTTTGKSTGISSDANSIQKKVYDELEQFKLNLAQQKADVESRYNALKAGADEQNKLLMDTIKQKFAGLKTQMEDVNSRLGAQVTKNQYETDAFRYTANQAFGTVAKAESDGIQRLADLQVKENEAILAASQAKTEGDYEALGAMLAQVDKINADRLAVLREQSDVAVNIEKELKAKTETKVTTDGVIVPKSTSDQVSLAKNLAPYMLTQISKLTGPDLDTYFEEQSTKYGVPTSLLRGQVEEYRADQEAKKKTAATGGTKAPKKTESELQRDAYLTINRLLDSGAKYNGVPFVDSNGFLTPEGFIKIVQAAAPSGLTKKQVLAQYADRLYLDDPDALKAYRLTKAELKDLGIE